MKFVHRDGIDFEVFPTHEWLIQRLVSDPVRNYLPLPWLRWLLAQSKSPLIRELTARPGGWRGMEIIYENAPPVDPIDRSAIRYSAMSMAARNRRRFVVHTWATWIRELRDEPRIGLLSIGSGPAYDIFEAVQQSGVDASRVAIWLCDLDPGAFDAARQRAEDVGMAVQLTCRLGDARHLDELVGDQRFHCAKLMGLIEYLDDDDVRALFRSLAGSMHAGGRVLTTGLVDRWHSLRFLRRAFGFDLRERTGERVAGFFREAGFADVTVQEIPHGVFPMVVARR